MFWKRYPLFRVFIAYSSGVLLANFFSISWAVSLWTFGLASGLILALAFLKNTLGTYRHRLWLGVSMQLLFLALGLLLSKTYAVDWHSDFFAGHSDNSGEYLIQITDEPKEKQQSIGMQAKLLAQVKDDSLHPAQGGLMLYLEKDSLARQLQYGDQLYFRGYLKPLQPPANPYEFDYRNYLNLKGVYFQAYAPSGQWAKGENHGGFGLKRLALAQRKKLMALIAAWQLPARGEAISKALLLGFRDEIDDDMMRAFSAAGAMHVLAVSGLHVGIIFIMAGKLLFFLDHQTKTRIIKSFILVLILWMYALLTGLSASVVRAATMFTFLAIGTAFQRNTSIYNTLIVSALFLMFIKPTYLFEVGFQLSYAAVFGIVWMQPRFMRLIPTKTKVGQWFWGIVTVSLAAQIATFPLGLYYFHQFPSLFLISNILVIPLVTMLMYLGIACLFLSMFNLLPDFLLMAYEFLLAALTRSVNGVEQFSIFLLKEIHINRAELVLFYLIILFFFSWLFSGRKYRLQAALLAFLIVLAFQYWENLSLHRSQTFTAYKISNEAAFGFYAGDGAYFLSDSGFQQNYDAMTFHVRHHWWAQNCRAVNLHSWEDLIEAEGYQKNYDLICFKGRSFWLVNDAPALPTHYWLVNYKEPPQSAVQPEKAVILSAVSSKQKSKWEAYAASRAIKLISIPDSGRAFQLEWGRDGQEAAGG